MPSILASSYVSISTAVAYTTPFLGALLADNILGEYWTILLGSILCYIPGLLLIALSTIPGFLGEVFNEGAVRWGLLVLWPIGTGTVKACVNVFGAKQFHPILQSSLIESYYVNFYSEFVELNEMECVRLLLVLAYLVGWLLSSFVSCSFCSFLSMKQRNNH